MGDLIGLGIIILLIVGGLFGLSQLGKPYEVTTEEFERRAQEGASMLSAGVMGLQKILDPAQARAEVAQQEFKQQYEDGEQKSGDGSDTMPATSGAAAAGSAAQTVTSHAEEAATAASSPKHAEERDA